MLLNKSFERRELSWPFEWRSIDAHLNDRLWLRALKKSDMRRHSPSADGRSGDFMAGSLMSRDTRLSGDGAGDRGAGGG